MIAPIWQDVFQRPSIGSDEDFFTLGGNPFLARQIFAQIERFTGKFFPPEMIYQAPTVADQCRLLQEPSPTLQSLALLKPGAKNASPIFLAHGIGGSVLEFFDLVKCISPDRAIYGLQAPGTDGVDKPFETIRDLALYYLNAIKTLQPAGPYSLIGYSLGGLVMLEVSHQLSLNGERVDLLTMVDAYPYPKHLSFGQRARLSARRRTAAVVKRCLRILPYPDKSVDHSATPNSSAALTPSPKMSATMQRAYDSAHLALERYQPRFYSGKVNFVRAKVFSGFPVNPLAVWGKLVGEMQIQTVPGDHYEILTKHYQLLGTLLSKQIAGISRVVK